MCRPRSLPESLGHPVGHVRPVQIRLVGGDVVCPGDDVEEDLSGQSVGGPLGLRGRDESVELAGHHERRLVDQLHDPGERKG